MDLFTRFPCSTTRDLFSIELVPKNHSPVTEPGKSNILSLTLESSRCTQRGHDADAGLYGVFIYIEQRGMHPGSDTFGLVGSSEPEKAAWYLLGIISKVF